MAKNREHINLDKKSFLDYLKGKTKGQSANDFERSIIESSFEQEAMEGLESIDPEKAISDIKELERKIENSPNRNLYFAIAAAISILILASISWFAIYRNDNIDRLALKEPAEGPKIAEEDSPKQIEEIKNEPNKMVAETEEKVDNKIEYSLSDSKIGDKTKQDETSKVIVSDSEEEIRNTLDLDDVVMSSEIVLEETKIEGVKAMEEIQIAERELITDKTNQLGRVSESRSLQANNTVIITGKIKDEDNESLPGVSILLKRSGSRAITNIDGSYKISIPRMENESLIFSLPGFETQEIKLTDTIEVNVNMNPDLKSLSEVVVTGYGVSEFSDYGYSQPTPIGGKRDFDLFIEENKVIPEKLKEANKTGKVVLALSINEFGEIVNIEIRKGLGFGCDEEALRLVQEFVGWSPAIINGRAVSSTVKIKIKFP